MSRVALVLVAATCLGCGGKTGLLWEPLPDSGADWDSAVDGDADVDWDVDAEVDEDGDAEVDAEPAALRARVAVGREHSCAVTDDGAAWCWGRNDHGQLGDGTTTERRSPVPVQRIAGVAGLAGDLHSTCAWLRDGALYCWGANNTGRLGDGTLDDQHLPVRIDRMSEVAGMTRGADVLAWQDDGSLWRLGWGSMDRLWVRLDGLDAVAGATSGGLYAGTGGTTWAWLRDGTALRPDLYGTSHAPLSALAGVAGVTAGWAHTCAWLGDGSAFCWGYNLVGQLGDGTATERIEPTRVLDLDGVVGMAAGEMHTCAWLADGSAFCWGDDSQEQLGNGAGREGSRVPTRVLGLDGVQSISTRAYHACALLAGGQVWCWGGGNGHGQLGIGTDRATPGVPARALLPEP